MKINLIQNNPTEQSFNKGDVLVFYNNEEDNYDYHSIAFDNKYMLYRLVSLNNFQINDKWNSLEDMESVLNNKIKNGYKLIEVINSDNIEIRRIVNDTDK
jgi:hypothetical protein